MRSGRNPRTRRNRDPLLLVILATGMATGTLGVLGLIWLLF